MIEISVYNNNFPLFVFFLQIIIMKLLAFLLLTIWSAHLSQAVPDDVEILEGFSFNDPTPIRTAPETEHLLTQFLIKAIRNRRSPRYEVLESEGLRSHFKTYEQQHYDENFDDVEPFTRTRRSVDSEVVANDEKPAESAVNTEELPSPEKLVQNGYYDDWSKYTDKKDDMDTQAEASAINEGIKARAPRVNFITQNQNNQNRDGKSLDVSESRDARSSVLPETTTPDYYRKNLARIYLDYPRPYDSYPRPYEYERNYVDRMGSGVYPEYYDARRGGGAPYEEYDSYMPRTLNYPNYYYYPDKRYDVPEARDPYPPTYTNEIPPLSPINRNRRIIYYTTLPEVVRTPPNVNLNLKSRYDPYERMDRAYNYPYNYYNYAPTSLPPMAPAASYNYMQAAEAYRSNRSPRDYIRPGISSITPITKEPHLANSGRYNVVGGGIAPIQKVKTERKTLRSDSSSSSNQNSTPDRRMFTEVKDARSNYQQQDGSEDRGHYFSRHH